MDVGNLRGFKTPLPVKGIVDLEITQGRDFTGKEDSNGEKSRGYSLKYRITGPDYAVMNDGNSAIGFEFEELVTLPRETLERENPTAAARMKKRVLNRIEGAFGEDFPSELNGTMFTGKRVKGEIYTSWDDYAGDTIVKLDHLSTTPF